MRHWKKTSLSVCAAFFTILALLSFLIPDDELEEETAEDCCRRRRSRHLSVLGPTFLVTLILSAPDDREGRDAIRKTWFNFLPSDCRAYFAIGTRGMAQLNLDSIYSEMANHPDIMLLPDIADTYNSLTDKLIAAFTWLFDNVEFSYILKTDLDTFARVQVIAEELHGRMSEELPLYWGFFDGRARVKNSGRWAELSWNLCDRYLPHARGGGYVLSASIVEYVANNAALLRRFSSEDVSIGVWTAALNIERRHDPRFDTEHVSRGCHNSYIVTHKQDADALHALYKNLLETGRLCGEREYRHRLSYVYDWSVPPSICCFRNDTSIPWASVNLVINLLYCYMRRRRLCLSVCSVFLLVSLFICLLDHPESYEPILMRSCEWAGKRVGNGHGACD